MPRNLLALLAVLKLTVAGAVKANPTLAVESILMVFAILACVSMGLNHLYKIKKLEIDGQKALLRTLERLNLPTDTRVGRQGGPLSWLSGLKKGGRRWRR
jgi:hypothetical protein